MRLRLSVALTFVATLSVWRGLAARALPQTESPSDNVTIAIDHNIGASATSAFKFPHLPSPSKTDAASTSKVTVIAGTPDAGSADPSALVDGLAPTVEDEPGANLFFKANSWGGRIRLDFGKAIDIAQILSYSWHPDARAPQVYYVYGSDGTSPAFDPAPAQRKTSRPAAGNRSPSSTPARKPATAAASTP